MERGGSFPRSKHQTIESSHQIIYKLLDEVFVQHVANETRQLVKNVENSSSSTDSYDDG